MDDFSRFVRQFKPRREQDADEEPAEPYYVRALRAAAANGTALDINCRHLHTHSKDLYTQLVRYPQEVVPIMDLVITEELERLKLEAALDAVDDECDAYGPPPRVQVRPYNLREVHDLRDLDPENIDQLVAVAGSVETKSSTRLQCERMRQFRRELFGRASRTRRERSIRPKISRIDFDVTELPAVGARA